MSISAIEQREKEVKTMRELDDNSIDDMFEKEVEALNQKIVLIEHQSAIKLSRLEEHAKLEELQMKKLKIYKD